MKNDKTHWRKYFNEKNLGSWDLEKDGKFITVIVTIERIYSGEFVSQMGKAQKPFIKFKEFPKPMVINKTNFKRLEKRFGTFDDSQFIGKQVYLNVEKTDSPEGKVDALRILSKQVKSVAEAKKTVSDERFELVCENIKAGNYSKKEFLEKHQPTESQKLILDTI